MSSFVEGQIHQLAQALERAGFTAGDVTNLGQFSDLTQIRDVVRGELIITARSFPTWRVVALGTGLKTADEFASAIEGASMHIEHWAKEMTEPLAGFRVCSEKIEIELVNTSVAELGFRVPTKYKDIWVRAKKFGLNRCSPEVGPQLRLQYTDQPYGEDLIVATRVIVVGPGKSLLFEVCTCDSSLGAGLPWLCPIHCEPDDYWPTNKRFLFQRLK